MVSSTLGILNVFDSQLRARTKFECDIEARFEGGHLAPLETKHGMVEGLQCARHFEADETGEDAVDDFTHGEALADRLVEAKGPSADLTSGWLRAPFCRTCASLR